MAMEKRLTSPARVAAAVTAALVAVVLLAPVCRMPSCDGGAACGSAAPERSRFKSACGHEAPEPDGGSCDGATTMRHEDPAAPPTVREAADAPLAAAVLPGGMDAGAQAGITGAPRVADEKPPAPPPDPLFGRLVI